MRIYIIGIYFLSFTGILCAESLDTIHIQGVEVRSKGSSTSSQGVKNIQISSEIVEKAQNLRLSSLLSSASSVFIKNNTQGGLATPSFRGTGASHTQVLWNGIPVNSQLNGSADFSIIPVFFNDEISLLYGGSSLSQNGGSLGGSIALRTLPDWGASDQVEIAQEIASFSTYQTFLSLRFSTDRFISKTKAFYAQSRNDFPYLNTANGSELQFMERRQYAQFQNSGILQEFYMRGKGTKQWALKIYGQQYFRKIPTPIIVKSNDGKEKEGGESLKSILEFSDTKTSSSWHASIAYLFDYMRYTDERKMQNQTARHRFQSILGDVDYKYLWENISLKTGFQAQYHQVRSDAYFEIHHRTLFSLYAQVDYQVLSSLRLYIALREEVVNNTFSLPLTTLGLDFRLLKKEEFFFKLSGSYNEHNPSLNDLYWKPGGNPSLKSEKSLGGEAGFSYEKDFAFGLHLQVEWNAYMNRVKDWILWQPLNATVLWTPVNLKEVLSYGSEVDLTLRYHFTTPKKYKKTFSISEQTGYAYTPSINRNELFGGDASVGKQLIYVPVHNFRSLTTFSTPWAYIQWQVHYVGLRYVNTDNTQYLPAYISQNFSLGGEIDFKKVNIGLEGKIENIFNVSYEAVPWQPMPGRSYHLCVKIKIKNIKR